MRADDPAFVTQPETRFSSHWKAGEIPLGPPFAKGELTSIAYPTLYEGGVGGIYRSFLTWEMRPAQLSTQWGDNFLVRKSLGKPDHVEKVALGEPLAMFNP